MKEFIGNVSRNTSTQAEFIGYASRNIIIIKQEFMGVYI